jgi:glycerophosphoryl diester phosphodiesterase
MFSISKSLLTVSVAAGALFMPLASQPSAAPAGAPSTFLIAHRGASAYAPEHTIEAYRLAVEQGADYVEPDVAITKDGALICSHDTFLERVTNAATVFPDRFQEIALGGKTTKHWAVEDFTLAEIKSLDAGSWFDPKFKGAKVITFQEAIDFAKGAGVGIFPEIKMPSRLRAKGFDPEGLVVAALKKNNAIDLKTKKGLPFVQLQVFEVDSLQRLAKLVPELPRHFLVGTPDAVQQYLATPDALKKVKEFATGISPAYQILDRVPDLAANAHAAGLTVVPYTFSIRPKKNLYPDAPPEWQKVIEEQMKTLPQTREEMTTLMKRFIDTYKLDGLFTDNPDLFPR